MGLAIDYRPETLDELIGNDKAKKSLENIFKKESKPKAFLLVGPTGCGKTTIARIIAKHLNCNGNDFVEMDSADDRGIDVIRKLRAQAHYQPTQGDSRVWLLDESHRLTPDAQEALLKSLEEPPKHVYYILATTDPQKLKPTLKGRCIQIDVSQLSETDMMKLLAGICRKVGTKVSKTVAEAIVEKAEGHPRNALQLLEKCIGLESEDALEAINEFNVLEKQSIDLCRALMENKPNWKKISTILKDIKADPEAIRQAVLGYASAVLLNSGQFKAYNILEAFETNIYDTRKAGLVIACYRAVQLNNS